MTDIPPPRLFEPEAPDAAGVITWVHLGDLHMTVAGQQNHLDLLRLVEEVNEVFAGSVSFVFLPGDVADHGSLAEYEVARGALDCLTVPWCAIVGDHDVHERSFESFQRFMARETHGTFRVGAIHFFTLNAFDVPDPGSFVLLSQQLSWLEQGLQAMAPGVSAVLLLHCYPTDLKQGGGELLELTRQYPVRLIDMGHTHYNEVANDGRVLYTATRSTGQIEEGPVGFSVTNIDGGVVSWRFFALVDLPPVMITSPADERFLTERSTGGIVSGNRLEVRVKAWSTSAIASASASVGGRLMQLEGIGGSNVWRGETDRAGLRDGVHLLTVEVVDAAGKQARDEIRVVIGDSYRSPQRAERDQDNALLAWPERGLLGTQLGPNKYGRKW